jgi:hypothetical protein
VRTYLHQNGETRDEGEREEDIEADEEEQEDDNYEENNDKAQQEKNDTDNNEKAKCSVQRKEEIHNMRVRGKKAVFPKDQDLASLRPPSRHGNGFELRHLQRPVDICVDNRNAR